MRDCAIELLPKFPERGLLANSLHKVADVDLLSGRTHSLYCI